MKSYWKTENTISCKKSEMNINNIVYSITRNLTRVTRTQLFITEAKVNAMSL